MIGTWEFSNADRDKICTVTFRAIRPVGFKVEFDENCGNLFPLVTRSPAGVSPTTICCGCSMPRAKRCSNSARSRTASTRRRRRASACCSCRTPPPPGRRRSRPSRWPATGRSCAGPARRCAALTLATTAGARRFGVDGQAGLRASIARLNFAQWRMDRGELVLVSARGNPWRFEEVDDETWRRAAGKRRSDHAGAAVNRNGNSFPLINTII